MSFEQHSGRVRDGEGTSNRSTFHRIKEREGEREREGRREEEKVK